MVFIVDEDGDLKGLVTLQNMMDALTGEFFQEDVNDQMVIQREDGSLLRDGLIPIFDLKDSLGIKQLPNEEDGHYQTLNGFFMYELGKIPQTSDIFEVAGGDSKLWIWTVKGLIKSLPKGYLTLILQNNLYLLINSKAK